MKRAALVIAAALLLALIPGAARADGFAPEKTLFAPFGVNVGYGINPPSRPNGLLLGGELSLVYFDNFRWIGAYTDVLYDFGAKQTRVSVGPEVGVLCFTLDGGYLGGDAGNGWVVRILLDAIVPHLYGRVGGLVDSHEQFGEIGILLKLPAPVVQLGKGPDDRRRRQDPPPPPPPPPVDEGETPTPEGPLLPDGPESPSSRDR